MQKTKIPIEVADDLIQDAIESGKALANSVYGLVLKSDTQRHNLDVNNFKAQYHNWVDATWDLLQEIFPRGKVVLEFVERRTDAQNPYTNLWYGKIITIVGNELNPKLEYLRLLRERLSSYQYEKRTPEETSDEQPPSKISPDAKPIAGSARLTVKQIWTLLKPRHIWAILVLLSVVGGIGYGIAQLVAGVETVKLRSERDILKKDKADLTAQRDSLLRLQAVKTDSINKLH